MIERFKKGLSDKLHGAAERAGKVRERASSRASDLRYDVFHSRTSPLYMPYMAVDSVKGAYLRASRSYDALATFCAGDHIASRVASMLEALSELHYDDADPEWFDALRPTAEQIRAYQEHGEVLDLMLQDAFKGSRSPEGDYQEDPLIKSARDQLDGNFLATWMRAKELLFGDSYTVPREVKEMLGGTTLSEKANRTFGKVSAAVGRIRKADSVSLSDIAAMPYGELEHYSSVLIEFACENRAYSPYYLEDGKGLRERGEDWADHQALAAAFIAGDESMHERVDEHTSTIVKNSENPAWAAWVEDVTYAHSVLGMMADWTKPKGLRETMETCGVDSGTIGEMESRVRTEFDKTWEWIGKRIDDLAQ